MVFTVEVATGVVTPVASGDDALFGAPAWTRDGSAIVAIGDRFPRGGYRTGIWRFAADGSDAGRGGGTDLLASSELKPDAAMTSDVTLGRGRAAGHVRGRDGPCCSRHRSTGATSCGASPLAGGVRPIG